MVLSQSLAKSLVVLCASVAVASTAAQGQQPKPFEPQVGQAGKDVIWVPTGQELVNKMLETAKVTPQDFVIDLGSGDGRTVITAAKQGAKALGIEYNPDMVELSRQNAEKEGVTDRATFVKADLFESDFSQATVITMFLLSDINLRLRPRILDLKPGTRIVSNTFDMGDWAPDQTIDVDGSCSSYCRAYFWIVPAKVEGEWKLGDSTLKLNQKYQEFTGTLTTGNVIAPINDGKLRGDAISFSAGGTRYAGRVSGNTMEGKAQAGSAESEWQASR